MSFEEMVKINGHSESKPLGVLKADVDNLGAIFAVGLEPYKHESKMNYKLTFSRLSAMSRMINIFFAYYLPEICKKDYQNVYTVFAGGDDLFLIGPYDEIIELNFKINEDFKLFTGNNEDVTISSAIGLFKHNTPVVYMAEIVEENLKNAKSFSSDSFVKGQMSVLGVVEKPESFKDFYKRFTELLSKSSVKNNTSFWYKVMSFIDMKIKVSEDKKVNLINLMWLPRLKYSLARNIKDKVEREKMAEFLIKSIEENPKLLRAALSINLYKIRYGG
jgi:CRISPR-associated protein Csm1